VSQLLRAFVDRFHDLLFGGRLFHGFFSNKKATRSGWLLFFDFRYLLFLDVLVRVASDF
jgi:hypothetical protein